MNIKRHAPAAERNKNPILDVLREFISEPKFVLTIAEGSGQHVVFFAEHLPQATFQPTDVDPTALASIAAYVAEGGFPNVRPPLALDAMAETWPVEHADIILCINMIHISPWIATEGLFRGAARILPEFGYLITYGPYRFSGEFTAPSNQEFDASLRGRNPEWGVRDVDDLRMLASAHGLMLEGTVPMPANNHCLVFARRH
ncbi:MAG TPA: DUF938 domain-containing protein [Polyangium sp.]|nr:DUF938 domain-containing protein [Polyangium sp.]